MMSIVLYPHCRVSEWRHEDSAQDLTQACYFIGFYKSSRRILGYLCAVQLDR